MSLFLAQSTFALFSRDGLLAVLVVGALVGLSALFITWLSLRYIPNNAVAVVEKLWSATGSVPEGRIIALHGEAGFQAELLRGGMHWGLWRWQYRVHTARLVTIPQGKIGYVYARDGEPLPPAQTLARTISCNNFQDARTFLGDGQSEGNGQRGRQRVILREGVYAINPALFVVITEDAIFTLRGVQDSQEAAAARSWQADLVEVGGFRPAIVGGQVQSHDPLNHDKNATTDSIAIVTIHDGPSLLPGEIIAPAVGTHPEDPHYHNNYQNIEAFLSGGGSRGRQHQPLTDGTYFLNRWFATTEIIPKTTVPIGHVGVVVSYVGRRGRDLSGEAFRHGERVAEGERGVWERPLGPGKYAFNTYAGNIIIVPTTNFVLHWITGRSESHRFDESLKSIELVTKDAYEPRLPLSVVVHIDYQRAPNVIQRFGDVKRLITQTLDPMLSAYFRDIAHKKTMLELLHDRDLIQDEARQELRRKFREFDIECVDVLIGKPDTEEKDGKIETLLEQLRLRQLSIEQLETYERQRAAADKQRMYNDAHAQASMQTQLTNARVQAQIADSEGEAELARARKQAEKRVVLAEADLAQGRLQAEQVFVLAEAEKQQKIKHGEGDAQRVLQVGLSEATVQLQKIASFGDPRLFALTVAARSLATSTQPLVPERVFIAGGNSAGDASQTQGMLGLLLNLLVAEKSEFSSSSSAELSGLKDLATRLTRSAVATLERGETNGTRSEVQ